MTRFTKPFGQKPGTKRQKSDSMQAITRILPAVGKNLNLDQKVQEWSVMALWAQIIDTPFQTTSRAQRIETTGRHRSLIISVPHATVAAELTFYLDTYLARLNAYHPQTGLLLTRIRIRVS